MASGHNTTRRSIFTLAGAAFVATAVPASIASASTDAWAPVIAGLAAIDPVSAGASGTTIHQVTDKGSRNRVSPDAAIPSASDGEGGGIGHTARVHEDQRSGADPATIAELREQWRRRQAWHRAEKSLTLQSKALCRRLAGGEIKDADKLYRAALGKGEHPMAEIAFAAMFPLIEARDGVAKHRAAVEKRLVKLAKLLPVAPYVESVRGVGLASLAAIVGEAGDLSNYSTPAKLWKRFGLAVMDDGRQRRVAGAAALDHGYSPSRRSVMWNVGSCIVKAGGPLKEAYDARKLIEATKVETKAHAHNRAQRFVEKRFLRSLWVEWNRSAGTTEDVVLA